VFWQVYWQVSWLTVTLGLPQGYNVKSPSFRDDFSLAISY